MPIPLKIKRILDNFENRISALEKVPASLPTRVVKGKKLKATLQSHILTFRNQDYFTQARTAKEVHSQLSGKYPCDANRVAMALLRLSDKKMLRVTNTKTKGKTLKAYAW
jgi:hypothetical protein